MQKGITLTLERARALMKQNDGNLFIKGKKIVALPDGLTVEKDLDIEASAITELPKGLKIGGSLLIRETEIQSIPDDIEIYRSLIVKKVPLKKFSGNLKIGGGIDISRTLITELPDNLTVCGGLDISGTKISKLPKGLCVAGWLDIRCTEIEELTEDLKANFCITSLTGNLFTDTKKFQQGEYVEGRYLYADGILTHIRTCKKVGDYTVYVGKIPRKNVVSNGVHFAHCDKLHDGIADLLFKAAEERGIEQYRELSLDSQITVDEAVSMYRVITGACRQGCENFIKGLGTLKEKYTVKECIELTKGQYGSVKFTEFFSAV